LAGVQSYDDAWPEIDLLAVLERDRAGPRDDDEHLVGLGVGDRPRGQLPDADLDPEIVVQRRDAGPRATLAHTLGPEREAVEREGQGVVAASGHVADPYMRTAASMRSRIASTIVS